MKESTPTPIPVTASKSLQNVEEQSIVTENVAAIESTPVEEQLLKNRLLKKLNHLIMI